jgi:hypothetical protein
LLLGLWWGPEPGFDFRLEHGLDSRLEHGLDFRRGRGFRLWLEHGFDFRLEHGLDSRLGLGVFALLALAAAHVLGSERAWSKRLDSVEQSIRSNDGLGRDSNYE